MGDKMKNRTFLRRTGLLVMMLVSFALCSNTSRALQVGQQESRGMRQMADVKNKADIQFDRSMITMTGIVQGRLETTDIRLTMLLQRYDKRHRQWEVVKKWSKSRSGSKMIVRKSCMLRKKGNYRLKCKAILHGEKEEKVVFVSAEVVKH